MSDALDDAALDVVCDVEPGAMMIERSPSSELKMWGTEVTWSSDTCSWDSDTPISFILPWNWHSRKTLSNQVPCSVIVTPVRLH